MPDPGLRLECVWAPLAEPGGLPPIKGFLETSFVDWPGMIASVLFLPGCNYACPYCHNYALVSHPEKFKTFPFEHVLDRLDSFCGWVDGVVISGGEPTLHAGLPRLCAEIRSVGFKVKLDTNGSRPGMLEKLVREGLIDAVAMDLKAPLSPLAYARACGKAVDIAPVAESLAFLKHSGLPYMLRSTIWPSWHGPGELEEMAKTVAGAPQWELQALNPATARNLKPLGRGSAFPPEDLDYLQRTIADPVCHESGGLGSLALTPALQEGSRLGCNLNAPA